MKRHTTSIVALVATAVALVVVLGTVSASAQDVLLDENFDSYSPGGFPTGWDSVYGGTGWQYQVVTNDQWVSSPNSFTMEGTSGYSAVVDYDFASPPLHITYSGRVRVAAGAATANIASMSLWNKDEATWGMYYCQLRFGDTAIWLAATGVTPVHMQSYNREQWYHWKVEYDAVAKTASVWIDDVQVGTDEALNTGSLGYNALALSSEHGAKQCWYDDIYVTKPSAAPPNITLDDVDGLGYTEYELKTGTDVRFHIRLTNDQDLAILAFHHGFQVYSPDGASWRPITLDTTNLAWPVFFDLGIFLNSFSVTGSGADTVSLSAAVMFAGGFPPGYDEVILYIETEVYPADTGRHLCLDSAFFPPGGIWSWNMSGGGGVVIPNWDGPHCWEIVEIPNDPPVITNNPYSLAFDHCDMATYVFEAADPEGDPYWFEILAGPGTIDSSSGLWTYMPTLADVGYSHELVVRACDEFGCGPEEICYLTFTNMAPVFTTPCPDTVSVTAGDDLIYQFEVDDVDCDPSTLMVLDVSPPPVGVYYMTYTELTFETDALDEGIDYTFTVEVTDGFLSSDCILVVRVTRTYETLPGVSLYQIDFVFDSVQQYDSDWGSIEVDAGVLLAYEDADRLWINGVVDGEWVIQNLIVDSALAKVLKTYFGLRIPPGTDTHELPIDIQITLEPLIEILAGTPFLYPVGARGFNAEGASIDGESNTIIPTIMPPGGFGPYIENYEWVWPNIPGENVECAHSQCVPMSVANSLQWLENTYPGITVDHPHVPGLRGDTTLVGQLDECMERAVVNRANGSGVGFRKMLQGKFKYLKDNGLEDKIVNRHQVDTSVVSNGWLDSATVHYTEDNSVSSANETAPNGRVSWAWIYQQIQDGEDVELIYGYYNSSGVRGGGHAVRVFGAGKTNGRPWLMVKHDALQTDADPGDSLGLQEWFQWVDTLDDGAMTFGSENIKVDFALSESPADHNPTLHFYQLDLILDDIPYTDLDWGELDLTLTPQDDTSLVYLNVTVNGSWQIQNIPIWPPTADEGSKTLSIDFDLGVPPGTDIDWVNYGYSLTSTVVSSPPADTGITVVANREGIFSSGAGGVSAPAPEEAEEAKGGEVADPIKHAHKNLPNQDCGKYECAPASVSNSLKFLNKKHNMGLDEADLSIAKMKTACGFIDNWGCPRDTWWMTKKRYLEKNKIPVTTRKITDLSKLAAEIDAGQDVEIQGDRHTAAVFSITPLGGGKYEIEVAHDITQGPNGNGGLEVQQMTYDPATGKFTGSVAWFNGSSFRYAVVECPKVEPTPGIHRNPEDGYTPQDGSPVGRVWHEKRPNYCTWWAVIDWEDNGDDWFGYGDYVTFLNELTEETSREHIEEVTATITVVPMADPSDSTYLDFWYGRPDMEPIVPEQGDLWHEIWPDYCTMYEFEYWEDNGNGYLDSCDYIGLYVLSGPDSGMVQDYHVEALETDVISTPAPSTCCMGEIRGNVDYDADDIIDISDLVYLVDYMFNLGPAPQCLEEADIDGSGEIDISDLVSLVDYMFSGGPPPAACP